jgi:hypothetical protein
MIAEVLRVSLKEQCHKIFMRSFKINFFSVSGYFLLVFFVVKGAVFLYP